MEQQNVPVAGPVPARHASGVQVFSRNEPTSEPVPIPVGTVVATDSGIQFETRGPAEIPADSLDSGNVPVQAVKDGLVGNVDVDTVTKLVSDVPGVDTVTNVIEMTGGEDAPEDNEPPPKKKDAKEKGKVCVVNPNLAGQKVFGRFVQVIEFDHKGATMLPTREANRLLSLPGYSKKS